MGKPLDKKYTAKCAKCKHGRAAHGMTHGGHCKMKHCKCKQFHWPEWTIT